MQIRSKKYIFIVGTLLSFYVQTSSNLPKIDIKQIIENNKSKSKQSLLDLAQFYKDKQQKEMVQACIAYQEINYLNQFFVREQQSISFSTKNIAQQKEIQFDPNDSFPMHEFKDVGQQKKLFDSIRDFSVNQLIGEVTARQYMAINFFERMQYLDCCKNRHSSQADQFGQIANAYNETLNVKNEESELDQMSQEDCRSTAQEKAIRHQKKQAEAQSHLVKKSLEAQKLLDEQKKDVLKKEEIARVADLEKKRRDQILQQDEQDRLAKIEEERVVGLEVKEKQRLQVVARKEKQENDTRAQQEKMRIKNEKKKAKNENKKAEKVLAEAEKVLANESVIKIQAFFRGRSARQKLAKKEESEKGNNSQSNSANFVVIEDNSNIFVKPEIIPYEAFLKQTSLIANKRNNLKSKLYKQNKNQEIIDALLNEFDMTEGYKTVTCILQEYAKIFSLNSFDPHKENRLNFAIGLIAKINGILSSTGMRIGYFLSVYPEIDKELFDKYTNLEKEIVEIKKDPKIKMPLLMRDLLRHKVSSLGPLIDEDENVYKANVELLKIAKQEGSEDDIALFTTRLRESLVSKIQRAQEKIKIEEQINRETVNLKLVDDKINLYNLVMPLHTPGGILYAKDIKSHANLEATQLGKNVINNSLFQLFSDLKIIVNNGLLSDESDSFDLKFKETMKNRVCNLLGEAEITEPYSLQLSRDLVLNSKKLTDRHLAGILDFAAVEQALYKKLTGNNPCIYTPAQINDIIAIQIKLTQLLIALGNSIG